MGYKPKIITGRPRTAAIRIRGKHRTPRPDTSLLRIWKNGTSTICASSRPTWA